MLDYDVNFVVSVPLSSCYSLSIDCCSCVIWTEAVKIFISSWGHRICRKDRRREEDEVVVGKGRRRRRQRKRERRRRRRRIKRKRRSREMLQRRRSGMGGTGAHSEVSSPNNHLASLGQRD